MAYQQKPQREKRDFIFHQELVKSSPCKLTIDSVWREAPPKLAKCQCGLVDITVVSNGNDKRTYWCENQACAQFFTDDKVGQTVTVMAVGGRGDAVLQLMQTGAQIEQRQSQPAAPRQQAAPQRPTTPPAPTGKWQPLGATVGMAINNVCQSLTAQGKPLNPTEVWELASDLLAVARRLESGNLAPSYSERHARPQDQPAEPKREPKCQICGGPANEDGSCPDENCKSNDVPF